MKKSRSNNYWEQREQKWIEQRIKNDNAYLNEMVKRYEELANSIQQQINGFYAKYASDTGLTMSEAVKKINSFDVKSFEETAAKMVAKKDFSQYANDRLKIYNATMKINRLEFLKSQLGLEITNATNKEELVFNDYLLKSYQDELKRQSGILGYHKNVDLKQSATTVVNASFHGATWSSRLWINQDVLKAKLDTLLSRAMIQGTNPKQMIASLRANIAKEINNTTSVIENLVVTESARVQDVAQMESLKSNDFKFCKWIAEPTACKRCREIAESNNEHGIGVYRLDDVPMIPEHPRCRCSKAAYWVDEKDRAEASRLERKKNTERRVTINKEKQRKLTAEFRKNGGKVWQGSEAEHYLKSRGAAAMTLGDATIVLQNKPTISEVLEELYHIEQFKNGEIDDDISKYKAEIEAQNYLLSVEKMYNIPRREIEETKRNLNYWKGKLENENK